MLPCAAGLDSLVLPRAGLDSDTAPAALCTAAARRGGTQGQGLGAIMDRAAVTNLPGELSKAAYCRLVVQLQIELVPGCDAAEGSLEEALATAEEDWVNDVAEGAQTMNYERFVEAMFELVCRPGSLLSAACFNCIQLYSWTAERQVDTWTDGYDVSEWAKMSTRLQVCIPAHRAKKE